MPRDIQLRVALEFGFPDKIVRRVMSKYTFASAGDLVEYLESLMEKIEAGEEEESAFAASPPPQPHTTAAKVAPVKKDDKPTPTATSAQPQTTAVEIEPGKEDGKPAPTDSVTPPHNSLRQETEELYQRSLCLFCYERRRCFVSLPCGHFNLCDKCEPKAVYCPIKKCEEKIEATIQTFM